MSKTCVDCGGGLTDGFRCKSCGLAAMSGSSTMSAEAAMAEIWGTICPDCGPEDYVAIVGAVSRLIDK